MPLIKLEGVSLAYGHVPLLDAVNLQIEPHERVCLVGRNGTGKSTLMGVIQGRVLPDEGQVWRQPGLRIAHLAQEVPGDARLTVFEVIIAGLAEKGRLLADYHRAAQALTDQSTPQQLQQLSDLQHALEAQDGWRLEQRVEEVITRLQLPADSRFAELSGGLKRRVMLAQALVTEPELLLLDEPTNHLDLQGIQWLEDFIAGWHGSLLFITHDRRFLQQLATRIIELDRGQLTSWPGDYAHYLQEKEHQLGVEADHNAKFDKRLAQEEVWIRQGIKARRTRNEGRVRALEALRRERAQRRELQGRVSLQLDSGGQAGKIVIDVEHASVSYDGRPVIVDFSTRILRGDKVGIIGPNGAGKTTLLKLLLGQLTPDSGTVKLGTKLEVAYFDQQRQLLDPEKTVLDNLDIGTDTVSINGRQKHVVGYLQDFLFAPARIHSPVSSLSGGERNRLLLARLFTRPANVLVMDEPTNDLDVETLELLEELLCDYTGTLLVVSHDREFLDNVITNSLVFTGHGRVENFVGGYTDWENAQRKALATPEQSSSEVKISTTLPEIKQEATRAGARKLSYKEQRELDSLPGQIAALEAEQATLTRQVNSTEFYRQDKATVASTLARLQQVNSELESCLERWLVLE